MQRRWLRLLALLFAFAMVAAACGDSDDSSDTDTGDDEATTTTAAGDDESTETTEATDESTETTEATDEGDEGAAGGIADATSLEEIEAIWADQRQAIVDDIVSNGYGVGDDNVLTGPAGFTIDLNDCPADWDNVAGLTDSEIRIGYTTAQSGNLAAYGDIALGWETILDLENEAGGIDGKQTVLIVKDDAYVASQTIEAVDELIQSENVFTITTLGSPNTMATYDTLNDACIPQPFVQTGHPAWGDPENHPWTTGLQMAYNTEAGLWATWIEENLADQAPVKVAGLVMDNDFGAAYEEGFSEAAEESDIIGEFVAIRHDPAAPTVTNEITTIAGEEPDVFISMTAGNPCLLAIQDAERAGLAESVSAKFTPSVCKGIEAFMAPAGDAAQDYLIVGGGLKDSTDPQYVDDPYISWMNEQIDAAGLDPNVSLIASGFAQFGWPYVQALKIAAELPDGLSRTNFMLAMRSLDMSHPLLLDGVAFAVDGNDDAYFTEGSEFSRFDVAEQTWVQEGEVVELNGESANCVWDIDNNTCG